MLFRSSVCEQPAFGGAAISDAYESELDSIVCNLLPIDGALHLGHVDSRLRFPDSVLGVREPAVLLGEPREIVRTDVGLLRIGRAGGFFLRRAVEQRRCRVACRYADDNERKREHKDDNRLAGAGVATRALLRVSRSGPRGRVAR